MRYKFNDLKNTLLQASQIQWLESEAMMMQKITQTVEMTWSSFASSSIQATEGNQLNYNKMVSLSVGYLEAVGG